MNEHNYSVNIKWTGNKGKGTSNYREFDRSHTISVEGKLDILGSSDPKFRGDKTKYNPEEFLIASLSSCHMLWYLHLCSENAVTVLSYFDQAVGTMTETLTGGGSFSNVTLEPIITVAKSTMVDKAYELHKKASELCFIANSVNFKVDHSPVVNVAVV